MVSLIRQRGIGDTRLLDVMQRLPRHRFVPRASRVDLHSIYGDQPCSIGHGQTLSQPYIVAYMTDRLSVQPGMRVLDVGCGSGYQAAVLAGLGATVHALERIPELVAHARRVLQELDIRTVTVHRSDGYRGWPDAAPYDRILVACAPPEVPTALRAQLAEGGRMVLPVGVHAQELVCVERRGGRTHKQRDLAVRFVPMVHFPEGEREEP